MVASIDDEIFLAHRSAPRAAEVDWEKVGEGRNVRWTNLIEKYQGNAHQHFGFCALKERLKELFDVVEKSNG